MTRNETFDLDGPVGRLEAVLMLPAGEARAAAVVCHAHPLHGGHLHFKVVFRAARALQQRGLAVLRFNFRGVGRSQGTHDYGRGEQDDASAALDVMQQRYPGRPLVLGGFSFGAVTALHLGARDGRVAALFALGWPLRHAPDLSFFAACGLPCLFVQGERDEFGAAADLRACLEPLRAPRELVVVPDGDHCFTERLEALDAALQAWAAAAPWEGAR